MRITNILAIILIILIIVTAYGLSRNESKKPVVNISVNKMDSLNNVIDSLQTELFILEDGCDYKQHQYEDVLFEYEFGISYLKDYHPKAYKDFHRIIGMKERYSPELDRENSKRLNQYKIK